MLSEHGVPPVCKSAGPVQQHLKGKDGHNRFENEVGDDEDNSDPCRLLESLRKIADQAASSSKVTNIRLESQWERTSYARNELQRLLRTGSL